MTSQLAASKRLWKEYRDLVSPKTGLKQVKVEVDDDNVFLWNVVLLVIDPESSYYGGYLKGELRFPKNYPFSPPNFRFTPAIYHPNVYNDGRLCISILHEAGNEQSDEPDNETWSPAQSVESVLLSILSLLEDPNISSPANVDAAIAFKKDKAEYARRIHNEVNRSRMNMPKEFTFPKMDDAKEKEEEAAVDNAEEWWEDEDDDDYYDDEEQEEEEEEEEMEEA